MTERTKPRHERKEAFKEIEWSKLLEEALTMPGGLGNTYNRFYNYSFMNQVLLFMQGVREPVATYKRWADMGRQVKRGSKAKTIIRPVITTVEDEFGREERKLVGFKPMNCLFTASETEGEEMPPVELPDFSPDKMLRELDIEEVPFNLLDGNVQGWSIERKVAINPVAVYPLKTLMHEVGHIQLGHTTQENNLDYLMHRGIKEFQAEATAYLVMNELGKLDAMNPAESRGYIQSWLGAHKPDDKTIREVFSAVNAILNAGRVSPEET